MERNGGTIDFRGPVTVRAGDGEDKEHPEGRQAAARAGQNRTFLLRRFRTPLTWQVERQ
jgi:hypothetical protein